MGPMQSLVSEERRWLRDSGRVTQRPEVTNECGWQRQGSSDGMLRRAHRTRTTGEWKRLRRAVLMTGAFTSTSRTFTTKLGRL